LGKFGDVPVNLFNGLPSVSIPLGKITVGTEFSTDLSLAYHAGGNRVNDIASNVGLGWALNAGGIITRTVRGLPDETSSVGYVNDGGKNIIITTSGDIGSASDYQMFNLAATNQFDTQPDEFNYNVGGISGKFVVNTNQQIVLLPYRDIKITWIPQTGGTMYFQMVTPDGTQYTFKSTDWTMPASSCGGTDEIYPSSWYLDQILLPKSKRTIDFTYELDKGLPSPSVTQTETSSPSTLISGIAIQGCPGATPTISTCYNNRVSQQQILKKITFPGGKITFNYNTVRTDVSNSGGDPFYALSDITVSSGFNNVYTDLNKYLLTYTMPSRLLLAKVSQADANNNVIGAYSLSYNSTHLPAVNSFSQDHWGYYNGVRNYSLLPSDSVTSGGDREPNITYAKADILESITYPTGGNTSFVYESNTYSHYSNSIAVNDPIYQMITASKSVTTGVNGNTTYPDYKIDSIIVNIPYYQFVKAIVTRTSSLGNLNSLIIRDMQTGATTNVGNGTQYLPLDSGEYHFVMLTEHSEPTVSYEKVAVDLTYKAITGTTVIATGGGLRLQSLTTYDGINHSNDITKSYTYNLSGNTAMSSGYLTNKPVYKYKMTVWKPAPGANTPDGSLQELACNMTYRTSAANNEIEAAGGGVVYKEVLETNNQNGSIRYVYALGDNSSGLNSYPFGPSTNVDPEKGMLKAQYTYDNTGKLLVKQENAYTTFVKEKVQGWKPAYTVKRTYYVGYPWEHFASNYYSYRSDGALLTQTKTTEYAGTDSLVNVVDTYYDNMSHIQPTRVHTTNSKGDDVWTYMKYPTDYTVPAGTLSTGLAAIKTMQDSSIHSMVIEQYMQQVKGGVTTTLGGRFIKYKTIPATVGLQVQMDTAFTLKRATPITSFSPATISGGDLVKDANYEAKISFTQFDSLGNIIAQNKVNDVTEVYIWGYNNCYPVAKITGTNYATAIAQINTNVTRNPSSDDVLRTELNKLRTGLTNVLVSSYTFKPLIGVTSETDPAGRIVFYEYDLFGRLKVVKDQNGKILKQMNYQYAQPITQ
jgi:YD repeat-containing protein